MRDSLRLVGFIFALSVLFGVNANATTPFADDLPDIRLYQSPGGSPGTMQPAFDLDEYVIDADDPDDTLSWSASVESGGPVVSVDNASPQPGLHEVDVMGQTSVGQWNADFTVVDSSATARVTNSDLKYSTFWLTEPSLTTDNRLGFKNNARFTYVKLFDGSDTTEQTADLTSYISPAATVTFGPMLPNVFDPTAEDWETLAPVAAGTTWDGSTDSRAGGLEATLTASNGVVTLVPSGDLQCAVLLAIPAVLSTSTFDRTGDWDGAVIMVAPAKAIRPYVVGNGFTGPTQNTIDADSLAQDCRFEDIAADGPIQPDGPANSSYDESTANSLYFTASWRARRFPAVTGSAAVGLISESALNALNAANQPGNPANRFPGDSSGNVLQVTVGSDQGASFESFNITPVYPGEVYGLSMNVATDIPDGNTAYTERAKMKLLCQTQPDMGIVVVSGLFTPNPTGTTRQTTVLPTGGKWRQIYAEIRVPEQSQALPNSLVGGGAGTSNTMSRGLLLNFRVWASGTVPAPFNVWIDNVYVYNKGMSDLNVFDANFEDGGLPEVGLANGVTALAVAYDANSATYTTLDMGFDRSLATEDNGFDDGIFPPKHNVGTTAGVSYGVVAGGHLNSANAWRVRFANAASRTNTQDYVTRMTSNGIAINGVGAAGSALEAAGPGVDNAGAGYYGLSFWLRTDAASVVECLRLKMYLIETRPTPSQLNSVMFVGPSCMPWAALGWKQYCFVGAYPELDKGRAMQRAQIVVEPAAMGADRVSYASYGAYQGANAPGYEGDQTMYLDDIAVHRVRDTQEYWNWSLFD